MSKTGKRTNGALCARRFVRREDGIEKRLCVWKGGRFSALSDYNSVDCQHSVRGLPLPAGEGLSLRERSDRRGERVRGYDLQSA